MPIAARRYCRGPSGTKYRQGVNQGSQNGVSAIPGKVVCKQVCKHYNPGQVGNYFVLFMTLSPPTLLNSIFLRTAVPGRALFISVKKCQQTLPTGCFYRSEMSPAQSPGTLLEAPSISRIMLVFQYQPRQFRRILARKDTRMTISQQTQISWRIAGQYRHPRHQSFRDDVRAALIDGWMHQQVRGRQVSAHPGC